MAELANRHADPRPSRLAEIAEKHSIPQRFLVQILLQLKAAGLVATTRGASGGYQLTRPPTQITLADVLAVVDGGEHPKEREAALETASSGLHSVWKRLTAAREKILSETTLADLTPSIGAGDFVI
jgi:Rrf2 family protein